MYRYIKLVCIKNNTSMYLVRVRPSFYWRFLEWFLKQSNRKVAGPVSYELPPIHLSEMRDAVFVCR